MRKILRKVELDQYIFIMEKYNAGNTLDKIAKEYKVSDVTISRILKTMGVKVKNRKEHDYKNDPVFTEICENYLQGVSIKILAEKYNLKKHIIVTCLKYRQIKSRKREDARKYKIKENYFDKIDSPIKSYFLGFLFADGCNANSQISINLKSEDSYILEYLSKEVFISNRPVAFFDKYSKETNKKYPRCRLNICNKKISEDLLKKGMCERKSLILKYPIDLPDCYFWDFLRGYFDGDGCVRVIKPKYGITKVTFSIVGTYDFLYSVSEKIKQLIYA